MALRPHLKEAVELVRESHQIPASEIPDEAVADLLITRWTELAVASRHLGRTALSVFRLR